MANEEKPWTASMRLAMQDGQWHLFEDIIAAGAAQVPSDRALQEMKTKQAGAPESRRVQTGQRNVAQQALTGMKRFGKTKEKTADKVKYVQWRGDDAQSIGDLSDQVDALRRQVEALHAVVEASLAQDDYQAAKAVGEDVSPPAESAREVYDREVAPLVS